MATIDRIEMNYFGLTLYVTTRKGKSYACKAVTWENTPTGRGLRVTIQSWPGYGSYRGFVHLTKPQRETFFKTMEVKV
jgi:hypothetical protein